MDPSIQDIIQALMGRSQGNNPLGSNTFGNFGQNPFGGGGWNGGNAWGGFNGFPWMGNNSNSMTNPSPDSAMTAGGQTQLPPVTQSSYTSGQNSSLGNPDNQNTSLGLPGGSSVTTQPNIQSTPNTTYTGTPLSTPPAPNTNMTNTINPQYGYNPAYGYTGTVVSPTLTNSGGNPYQNANMTGSPYQPANNQQYWSLGAPSAAQNANQTITPKALGVLGNTAPSV